MSHATEALVNGDEFSALLDRIPRAELLDALAEIAWQADFTPDQLKAYFDVAYLDWLDTLAGKRHRDNLAMDRHLDHLERVAG